LLAKLRPVKWLRVKLLLVKRCGRPSVGRSRVIAADGIVAEEIVVVGIAVEEIAGAATRLRVRLRVDVIRAAVSLVDVILADRVDGMRGWIRCASGLLLVVLGRLRRVMSLWI
jgi:hypothetical protein